MMFNFLFSGIFRASINFYRRCDAPYKQVLYLLMLQQVIPCILYLKVRADNITDSKIFWLYSFNAVFLLLIQLGQFFRHAEKMLALLWVFLCLCCLPLLSFYAAFVNHSLLWYYSCIMSLVILHLFVDISCCFVVTLLSIFISWLLFAITGGDAPLSYYEAVTLDSLASLYIFYVSLIILVAYILTSYHRRHMSSVMRLLACKMRAPVASSLMLTDSTLDVLNSTMPFVSDQTAEGALMKMEVLLQNSLQINIKIIKNIEKLLHTRDMQQRDLSYYSLRACIEQFARNNTDVKFSLVAVDVDIIFHGSKTAMLDVLHCLLLHAARFNNKNYMIKLKLGSSNLQISYLATDSYDAAALDSIELEHCQQQMAIIDAQLIPQLQKGAISTFTILFPDV